jgi:hypothetical protein
MPMTTTQRARHAALIRSSREDTREMNRAARAAGVGTPEQPGRMFVDAVLAQFPDLPDPEVLRRAGALRRAYFTRLSAAGVAARRKGRPESPSPAPSPATPGGVNTEVESTRATNGPKDAD